MATIPGYTGNVEMCRMHAAVVVVVFAGSRSELLTMAR